MVELPSTNPNSNKCAITQCTSSKCLSITMEPHVLQYLQNGLFAYLKAYVTLRYNTYSVRACMRSCMRAHVRVCTCVRKTVMSLFRNKKYASTSPVAETHKHLNFNVVSQLRAIHVGWQTYAWVGLDFNER